MSRPAWRTGLVRLVVLMACVVARPGRAPGADVPADPVPSALCRAQADAVEHAMALPPGLLLAVGRVESGRRDAGGHDTLPWPWSVNDEGADHVFRSAFDAIAYVVAARGRGSRSLDVGCFQVNLQFHPDAFATVAEAFDPAANARYAGQLLTDLHARSGSWETAVQFYHSATPWRGETYRDLVLAHWAETSLAQTGQPTGPPALPQPLPVPAALATHLPPLPGVAAPAGGTPARGAARLVRVQYPASFGTSAPVASHVRLPRVIVPSAAAPPAGPNGAH
jgi:hypothetical protein